MSGPIRFLADENFNEEIVAGLRLKQPQMDIQTAAEAGILGRLDPLVLAYAAERNRILLSHDVRTMPAHFEAFLAGGRHCPGVFLIAQSLPIGRAINEILLIWEASPPEEWRDQCTHLPL